MNRADHTSGMSAGTTNDITIRRASETATPTRSPSFTAACTRRSTGSTSGSWTACGAASTRPCRTAGRDRGGAVWLVDGDDRLLGALGLTDEG